MYCTVRLLEHKSKLSYSGVNGALATQPCCYALVVTKIHCILVGNFLVQGNHEWFQVKVSFVFSHVDILVKYPLTSTRVESTFSLQLIVAFWCETLSSRCTCIHQSHVCNCV